MSVSIHLPVANLAVTDQFCASLGLTKVLAASSPTVSTYILSQDTRVVAHTMANFSLTLREGDQPDRPSGARQMFVTIEVGSANDVGAFVAAAVAGGGQVYRIPVEETRGRFTGAVRDPDGHVWEAGFTDTTVAADQPWT
ncbi:MAG: VOC family protein [Galactobacter sp.]